MKKYLLILFFFCLSNCFASGLFPEQTLNFKRIGQVQVSPDGKQTAYVVMHVINESNIKKWQHLLYIQDNQGMTKLINKNSNISNISWSLDGKKLAFIAAGKKFQSIWLVDQREVNAKNLFEWNTDIQTFKWAPNGKFLAFVAIDKPTKKLLPISVSQNIENARLFLFDIENKKVEPLTANEISLSQGFNDAGFDWSPNSQNIVYAYQPQGGAAYSNASKIAILNLLTRRVTTFIYTKNQTGKQPVYSHNGKWIAFRTNLPESQFAKELTNDADLQSQVCVVNASLQSPQCLKNTFNESPVILGWDSSNQHVIVSDVFKSDGFVIYGLDRDGNSAKAISNVNGFIEPLTISLNATGTHIGFGYEETTKAPEAYNSPIENFQLNQVSHLNVSQTFGKTETIHWHAADGKEIEGLLMTPPNFNANKKNPLLVAVHGGPAGVFSKRYLGGCDEYGEMFDPTTCWGDFLQQGFVILAPNPRGSTGYGTAFRVANFGDFGGADYHDILSGVDLLIQKNLVNPDHMAIAGWSFGGYMTMWAISQSNRFKAAVAGDGNTDFISFSGTSDIPNYYVKYLGQPFWKNNALYLQRAPISFVKNINTPLLILSGDKDFRVPISQSYEMYTALKLQNKPVEMLIFPEQGHLPTDANIIFASMQAVDDWLKKTY